jgi:MYXO-CTERM domain-containing protein
VQLTGIPSLFAMSFTDLLHGFVGGAVGSVLGTVTGGEPSCQTAAQCPSADGGDLGYLCTAGACVPCNNDQTCGATCEACQGVTPFCLGGFCGQCRDTVDCTDGGTCIAGGCVINVPFDGGFVDGGPDAGPDLSFDAGHRGVTILPDGGVEVNLGQLCCGCHPGGGGESGAPWAVIGVVVFGAWAVSRRRVR